MGCQELSPLSLGWYQWRSIVRTAYQLNYLQIWTKIAIHTNHLNADCIDFYWLLSDVTNNDKPIALSVKRLDLRLITRIDPTMSWGVTGLTKDCFIYISGERPESRDSVTGGGAPSRSALRCPSLPFPEPRVVRRMTHSSVTLFVCQLLTLWVTFELSLSESEDITQMQSSMVSGQSMFWVRATLSAIFSINSFFSRCRSDKRLVHRRHLSFTTQILFWFGICDNSTNMSSSETLLGTLDLTPQSQETSEQLVNRLSGLYPIHWLVWHNSVKQLEKLLTSKGCPNIEEKDPRGRTPLMLAVTLGHLDCATILLKHNANVNIEDAFGFNGKYKEDKRVFKVRSRTQSYTKQSAVVTRNSFEKFSNEEIGKDIRVVWTAFQSCWRKFVMYCLSIEWISLLDIELFAFVY